MGNRSFTSDTTGNDSVWKYHLLALITATIWSTTFISTKILLQAGLSPEYIFFYRFLLAYAVIIFIARGPLFAKSVKDELMLLLAGMTGGSLYFFTENTALQFTYASNVAILISTTPLLTIALTALVFRKKLSKAMFGGSAIALFGVTLVVFNGNASFEVAPVGDLLTLTAALCWAVYGVVLKYLGSRNYSTLFITRKVFFYGVITIGIYLPFSRHGIDLDLLTEPEVFGNLLFLSLVASLICFISWNRVVEAIGPDKASNYIYLTPVGTITTAVAVLDEPLSLMAVAGAIITIAGVFIAEKMK